MDYEEKYKTALERAKAMIKVAANQDEAIGFANTIFPELAESENEDERIRKAISQCVEDMRGQFEKLYSVHHKDAIAWLEKQGRKEQLYIRFGKIPTDEKSKIYQGEIEVGTENGVSVYPAFKTDEGDIVLGLNLPITKTTLHTQQHLLEYDDRPCYLVKGDYVGKDTDGQPLINNVSIIKRIDSYRVKEKKQQQGTPVITTDTYCKENCKGYHETGKCYADGSCDAKIKAEQNLVWSKEDERNLQGIIDEIEANKNNAPDYDLATYDRFLSWLKSLKDRHTWKPSKEQMDTLLFISSVLKDEQVIVNLEELKTLYNDLKKL